jgi:hypothetical protein
MVGALVPSDSRRGAHLRACDLRKGFGDGAVLDGVSFIDVDTFNFVSLGGDRLTTIPYAYRVG